MVKFICMGFNSICLPLFIFCVTIRAFVAGRVVVLISFAGCF